LRLQDAAVTIDNKLRLATNTTKELNAVYDELRQISDRTRSSLEANAQLFQRVGLATKNLGLTYKEQTNLVEGFNQALIASGTQGPEVRAVTTQFAQAIGSGFKGDELRSIIEQAQKVAEVIADYLGLKSITALKELASQGKITPEIVVNAFKAAEKDLATLFAKVDVTGSQGFQLLSNAVVNIARDFSRMTGSSKLIGNALKGLAANLDIVAGAAAGLAIVVGQQVVSAFAKMSVALITNPLGALIVAFVAAGAAVAYFGRQTYTMGETTASGFQIMQAAWQTFYGVIEPIINLVVTVFEMIARGIQGMVGTASKDLPALTDVVSGTFNFILSTAKFTADALEIVFENFPTALKLMFTTAANAVISILENLVNGFGTYAAKAASIIALLDVNKAIKVQDAILDLTTIQIDRLPVTEQEIDLANKLAEAHKEAYSTDQIGKFKKEFEGNLSNIKKLAELNKNDPNQLNNKFGGGSAAGDEADEKALKKLQKARDKYIKSLNSEYDTMRNETGGAVAVVQEWYEKQKTTLAELGLSWEEYGNKVDAVFKNKMKEAYKKDLEEASNWEAGIERAAMKLQESFGDAADASEGVFTAVFSSLEDSLTNFVENGELSLDGLSEAITRIALQQAVLKPMSEYFSSGGGSSILGGLFGGSSSGGGIGSLIGGLFKDGGISTQPVSTSIISASSMRNAPSFDSGGLTSGGFPAILHPNEAVIPLSGGRKVPVDIGNNQGGNVNNVNFNISTPDANSFKRSEGQIAAKLSRTMSRAAARNN
jgi:tape measure domain-containing protein